MTLLVHGSGRLAVALGCRRGAVLYPCSIRCREGASSHARTPSVREPPCNAREKGLSPSPDVGGGGTLQGLFASNRIGMSIGGGFWAGGLTNAGMKNGSFDVTMFPQWKSQRALFGAGGYAIFKSSKK